MTVNAGLNRRQFLSGTSAAATVAAATQVVLGTARGGDAPAAAEADYSPTFFTKAEWAFINAAVGRLIPSDSNGPGGVDAGVPAFLDRQMELPYGHGAFAYMQGPFQPNAPVSLGYQLPLTPRELYRLGIAAADEASRQSSGRRFFELEVALQDRFLTALETGTVQLSGLPAKAFFTQLWGNVREGYFADPLYGGNRGMVGWKLIGFPGARADFTDWMDQQGKKYPYGPVSIGGRRA
jgi:gluconate 2-dehydrogenase gamma chain